VRETPPAYLASARRCARSTKCLPALRGQETEVDRRAAAAVTWGAAAESFPNGRRSAADRIAPSALALAHLIARELLLVTTTTLIPSSCTGFRNGFYAFSPKKLLLIRLPTHQESSKMSIVPQTRATTRKSLLCQLHYADNTGKKL
jgi:hypothetical protein